jgi:hypothetical protein
MSVILINTNGLQGRFKCERDRERGLFNKKHLNVVRIFNSNDRKPFLEKEKEKDEKGLFYSLIRSKHRLTLIGYDNLLCT